MHWTTVNGEKVQVGGFKKITRLDPLLYGKDYKVKAVTYCQSTLIQWNYFFQDFSKAFSEMASGSQAAALNTVKHYHWFDKLSEQSQDR